MWDGGRGYAWSGGAAYERWRDGKLRDGKGEEV